MKKYIDAKVKYFGYTKEYHVMHNGVSLYSSFCGNSANKKAKAINKMNRDGIMGDQTCKGD